VQGVNPVITPMFRHLFSPEDVARYGVRQPMQIPWAQFNPADPTRLDWLLGTMPNWWLPNQQIAWKPWVDEGDEDNED
jgi:hypothetical protein